MLFSILLLLNSHVFAQTSNPKFTPLSELVSNRVVQNSPSGRFGTFTTTPGVFVLSANEPCPVENLNLLFSIAPWGKGMKVLPENASVFAPRSRLRAQENFTAGELNFGLQSEVNRLLNLFLNANDFLLKRRQVCLGLVQFPRVNANSSPLGYLLFDPRIIFMPEQNSMQSRLSYSFVVAHEFSHQVQFWHSDDFMSDRARGLTSRRSELVADCMAGTMLTLVYRKEFSDQEWVKERIGLITSPIQLGDFDLRDEDHHGTGYERSTAVEYGVQNAENSLNAAQSPQSIEVMNACRNFVTRMDARYNPALTGNWPFGSPILY